MPATLEQLTAEVMALPERARALLAQRLIESLSLGAVIDVGDGYFLTAEQAQQIRQRVAASDADSLLTEEQFFARLEY